MSESAGRTRLPSRLGTPARPALLAALLLTAVLLPLPLLAQQEVRGTVVQGGTLAPLSGAMVVAIDASRREVVAGLTAIDGTFRLTLPGSGSYQLRVDRIGFTSTFSPTFDVPAGGRAQVTVETAIQAVNLPGLTVEGRGRCEVRPTRGDAAVVWEEVRKALEAARWTAERGLYRYVWTRYARVIAPDGRRIVSDERSVRQGAAAQPFVSLPSEVLRDQGFVRAGADGIQIFAGPDAQVLLSDAFLDTHCFTVERKRAGEETLIGLRFEPIRGRRLPEIEGVLWIEESRARLRSLDYRYVNLGRDLGSEDANGEMRFKEMPNGTWIVHEWRIRMPALEARQNRFREIEGYRVLRYQEDGGLVNRVTTEAGVLVDEGVPGRWIRGVVGDSIGRPAAGALVWIQGTDFAEVTDERGAFAISGLGPGVWSLRASHPALDDIGYPGTFQDVEVVDADLERVRLDLPSIVRTARDMCRGTERKPSADTSGREIYADAALLGRVVDAQGLPVPRARVRVIWNRYVLPATGTTTSGDGIRIGESWEDHSVEADASGAFSFCSVATHRPLRVQAVLADRASAVAELWIPPEEEVSSAKLVLGAPGSAEALPELRGMAVVEGSTPPQIVGTVRDSESGLPLALGSVELLDSLGVVRAQTTANAGGAFLLKAPAAGSYRVRGSHLAADTLVLGPFALRQGLTVSVDVALKPRAIALAGIEVAVARLDPPAFELRFFYRTSARSDRARDPLHVLHEGRDARRAFRGPSPSRPLASRTTTGRHGRREKPRVGIRRRRRATR